MPFDFALAPTTPAQATPAPQADRMVCCRGLERYLRQLIGRSEPHSVIAFSVTEGGPATDPDQTRDTVVRALNATMPGEAWLVADAGQSRFICVYHGARPKFEVLFERTLRRVRACQRIGDGPIATFVAGEVRHGRLFGRNAAGVMTAALLALPAPRPA